MTNARDVIARGIALAHGRPHSWMTDEEWLERETKLQLKSADAILTALHAANLAVVPVVATEEMVDSCFISDHPRLTTATQHDLGEDGAKDVWRSMIEAALTPKDSG